MRCILLGGQAALASYALLTQNQFVLFWNSLFFVINSIQVVRVLRARRPLPISADLQDLYAQFEPIMSRKDFLDFWHMGALCEVKDEMLIQKGERQQQLVLILSGHVIVHRDAHHIFRMSRGSFVSEMSFLTGEPATADVQAQGEVQYMAWSQEDLRQLQLSNPHLLLRVQGVLGKNLITKLHTAPIQV